MSEKKSPPLQGDMAMATLEYTKMQLKVISGEIPIERANGHLLYPLYKKAITNGDEELAKKAKAQLDVLKMESVEKNRQRSRNIYSRRVRSEFQWKQPKSNDYSDHHRKIIRGEIPLEDVHTKELISIHLRAYNNGDYELSERMLCLVQDRRKDSQLKHKLRKKTCGRHWYASKKSELNSWADNGNGSLTKWERALLMGLVDLDECSEEELERILRIVQAQGDEKKILVAEKLLSYKKDPKSVYVVRDHRAAIDRIEEKLQLPIRRPETWFVKE